MCERVALLIGEGVDCFDASEFSRGELCEPLLRLDGFLLNNFEGLGVVGFGKRSWPGEL